MPVARRSSSAFLLRLAAAAAAALLLLAPADTHATQGYGAITPDLAGQTGLRHITGGTQISIIDTPWQVRLKIGTNGICGGSILDQSRIVTAAHCTYDELTAWSPSAIKVISGSSSFNPATQLPNGGPPDSPITSSVVAIRRHPLYVASADGRTDPRQGRGDVAVLILESPIPLDGVVRAAIPLAERNSDLALGTPVSVSGFGVQNETGNSPSGPLYRLTDMSVLDPVPRTGEWNAVYVTATSPSGLDCSGDSGGPLVSGSGGDVRLVGLVAFSPDCRPNTTSTYTKVAAGEIRDFIEGDDSPPAAPAGGGDILLTADQNGALPLRPGRKLNCFPGTWTGNPSITVRFLDAATGRTLQEGVSTGYTISASDVGRRIACRASAATEGGNGHTPLTSSPPPVEQEAIRPTSSTARGALSAALRTRYSAVERGASLGVTFRIYSRGPGAARNVQACIALPRGWRVRSRGAAKVYGDKLCVKAQQLKRDRLLTATVSLRPGSSAAVGSTRLQVRATADNTRTAFGTRRLRVF